MKLNKKLIEQLRAGEIAVKNHPKNPETLKEVLKEAFPEDVSMVKGDCDLYALHKSAGYPCWSVLSCHTRGLPIIPIADFLLPDLSVGDLVTMRRFESWEGNNPFFAPPMEAHICTQGVIDELLGNGNYRVCNWEWPASALELVTVPEFIVGQSYEFSTNCDAWIEGKLLAIVDHRQKYIYVTGRDLICAHAHARPIQPKVIEIEKWAMYNPKNDTFFGKPVSTKNKCEEAYKHAPLDYKATKLTGRAKL